MPTSCFNYFLFRGDNIIPKNNSKDLIIIFLFINFETYVLKNNKIVSLPKFDKSSCSFILALLLWVIQGSNFSIVFRIQIACLIVIIAFIGFYHGFLLAFAKKSYQFLILKWHIVFSIMIFVLVMLVFKSFFPSLIYPALLIILPTVVINALLNKNIK